MMTYKQMVWGADKSKATMWKSVANVSCLIEKLWAKDPHMAREFLFEEYANMYQPHYDKALAMEEVNAMMHMEDGGEVVKGEVITMEEAMSMLPEDKREMLKYDAYVGFNSFAHDTAHANLSKSDVMKSAYSYWFCDDDFKEKDNKVWWYFSHL